MLWRKLITKPWEFHHSIFHIGFPGECEIVSAPSSTGPLDFAQNLKSMFGMLYGYTHPTSEKYTVVEPSHCYELFADTLQLHGKEGAKVPSDTCQPRCKSLRRTSGVSQISVSMVSLPVSGACKGACIETMARNEKQIPGPSLCALEPIKVHAAQLMSFLLHPQTNLTNTNRPNRCPWTHPVPCIRVTNWNVHTFNHNKCQSSFTALITLSLSLSIYIHGNQPVTRNDLSLRKQPCTQREQHVYERRNVIGFECLSAMKS